MIKMVYKIVSLITMVLIICGNAIATINDNYVPISKATNHEKIENLLMDINLIKSEIEVVNSEVKYMLIKQ